MRLDDLVARRLPSLGVPERERVANGLLDFFLRLSDANAVYAFLKPIVGRDVVKPLKEEVMQNFDIGHRLKYAMTYVARRPRVMRDPLAVRDAFAAFDLGPEDTEAFERLRHQKFLSVFIANAKAAPLDFASVEEAQRMCGLAIASITPWTRKFVIRKMRFLATAENDDVGPLIADRLEHAASTFYWITPWMTWDHTINTLKRAVHNNGINRLLESTGEDSQRLIGALSNKEYRERQAAGLPTPGYENRFVSLDSVNDYMGRREENRAAARSMAMGVAAAETADRTAVSQYELAMRGIADVLVGESSSQYQRLLDTFARLGRQYQRAPKKYMTLRLLSMQHIPDFVAWAQARTASQTIETTEDVLTECGVARFHELIREFVGAEADEFEAFIQRVRPAFRASL